LGLARQHSRRLENFIERAVIVTRGKSLDAPLGELRKATP